VRGEAARGDRPGLKAYTRRGRLATSRPAGIASLAVSSGRHAGLVIARGLARFEEPPMAMPRGHRPGPAVIPSTLR